MTATLQQFKRDIKKMKDSLSMANGGDGRKDRSYWLDVYGKKSTLSQEEKDTCQKCYETHEILRRIAEQDQKCTLRDIDWSKVEVTEEEIDLLCVWEEIFQRHAITMREKGERYPLH